MARCGVVKPCRGNVTVQDETESLPAVIDTSSSLSAVEMSFAAGGEEDLPSPFADIPALIHDHSYLPVRFDGLVDNALVYISGFVVRRALKKLSCDFCHASLVTDAASAIKDQSYHLLSLRNNGGLVIPSEGTVRVVRAAEWVIRQASSSFTRSQPIKLLEVMYIVRKRIWSEDVFVLGEHISDTQYGIDSHHHTLLTRSCRLRGSRLQRFRAGATTVHTHIRGRAVDLPALLRARRERFSCLICVDLLKDPVTTVCGHSYCKSCINTQWDKEEERGSYSCPQCRQTFTPRPVLETSTMLAASLEELKKTGLQAAPADHCYLCSVDEHKDHDTVTAAGERTERQRELGPRRQTIQQRVQDTEKDVKLLQQEEKAVNGSADKAVKASEEIFTELIRLLEERSSDVEQQIRSQQETEVSRVGELQERLEQEITELKRKDNELKQLSETEDYNQLLHNYPSLSPLSESTHSSNIRARPLRDFEDVTAAVSQVRGRLQDILSETGTKILQIVSKVDVLLRQPEPETRADFFKYSQEITMDSNTVNGHLLLSAGNRKVTRICKKQSYSNHPDRFFYWPQVLSRESLTGRCYWEVEVGGREAVGVAVTYKNIRRAGDSGECRFGDNDKSCSLYCEGNSYSFFCNSIWTRVSGPWSSRVGVYLDHSAGVLSFYSVSDTMTLLHRVQTTFTQPLYAGVRVYDGSTADFCKLK
ncbi:E3 ubiquitin-protein ligase TRIM11-like [Limanda limanda]|uniref:E3 ubiquitin-protein ligase TRIM11-like n=1 Tax=Limanda limanda TaxID=27771 RepID=UPI0029C72E1F|nr:E3 ubiquitin-protein ligase TRIM11-like [Limanda limanda]